MGGDSLSLSNSGGGSRKKKGRAPREGPKANAGASMQGSGKSQRTVIVQEVRPRLLLINVNWKVGRVGVVWEMSCGTFGLMCVM